MSKNSKAGRPPYKPTVADRRKVASAAGGGMSHEAIALALGICRNTLGKYFERELSIGAMEMRAKVLDAMVQTALKGNVAAQKAYLSMTPALGAEHAETAESSSMKLGKKEQAQADAETAAVGTDWDSLIGSGANVTPIRKQA